MGGNEEEEVLEASNGRSIFTVELPTTTERDGPSLYQTEHFELTAQSTDAPEELERDTEDEADNGEEEHQEEELQPKHKVSPISGTLFLDVEAEVDAEEEEEGQDLASPLEELFADAISSSLIDGDISSIDGNIAEAAATVEDGSTALAAASSSVSPMKKGLRSIFQGVSLGTQALKNVASSLQRKPATKAKLDKPEQVPAEEYECLPEEPETSKSEQQEADQPAIVRGLHSTAPAKPLDNRLSELDNLSLGLRNMTDKESLKSVSQRYASVHSTGEERNKPTKDPTSQPLKEIETNERSPTYRDERARNVSRFASSDAKLGGESENWDVDARRPIGGLSVQDHALQRNEAQLQTEVDQGGEGGGVSFWEALKQLRPGQDVGRFNWKPQFLNKRKTVGYKMNGSGATAAAKPTQQANRLKSNAQWNDQTRSRLPVSEYKHPLLISY